MLPEEELNNVIRRLSDATTFAHEAKRGHLTVEGRQDLLEAITREIDQARWEVGFAMIKNAAKRVREKV